MNEILKPQYEALMREDIITPIHHHDDAKNSLLATVDGEPRMVTPVQAGEIAMRTSPYKDLSDPATECTQDGAKNNVARRTLLKGAVAGFGALAATSFLPRYAFAATPTGEILVCIYFRGGFDGISGLVPVTDAAYYKARPKIAVPESATTRVYGSNFGLNNNFMPGLKLMIDNKEMAFVVSAGNPNVTRSHFDDQADMERSAPANIRSGWLGRYLAANSSTSGTFRAITMGNQAALSLSTNAFETIAMSNIADFRIQSAWDNPFKSSIMKSLDEMYKTAGGKASAQTANLFDALAKIDPMRNSAYTPANGAAYPETGFGSGMKDIARMIKGNLGMEVACIDLGDWDMHNGLGLATNPQDWFSRKAREFSQGLAAFRADLGPMWSKVTVVTMSEFGRRVYENGDLGVDHGHGNLMMVAGGGINGGVYGNQPSLTAANLTDGDVPITTDYRQVLAETLTNRFAANSSILSSTFPGFTVKKSIGLAKSAPVAAR